MAQVLRESASEGASLVQVPVFQDASSANPAAVEARGR